MNSATQADSVIYYEFSFEDGSNWHHLVDFQPIDTSPAPESAPDWAKLEFQQCPHCPLKAAESPYCPFALALISPVVALSERASHEKVEVTVQWRCRETRQITSLQRAAGSLLGAVGATSGCPHTRHLRAMAWFHQPFSTPDESLYRILGTYLLGQYLRQKRGLEADWDLVGLRDIYRNLREVNKGISDRLRGAAEQDSSLNGLILLDLLAADTLYSLERYEGELDGFFEDYFQP